MRGSYSYSLLPLAPRYSASRKRGFRPAIPERFATPSAMVRSGSVRFADARLLFPCPLIIPLFMAGLNSYFWIIITYFTSNYYP